MEKPIKQKKNWCLFLGNTKIWNFLCEMVKGTSRVATFKRQRVKNIVLQLNEIT